MWNISHFKNQWARYYQKCILVLIYSTSLFLSDFNETRIFSADFRKNFKHKIPWKSFQYEPSCSMQTDRRTDIHNESNSCFPQFCDPNWKFNPRLLNSTFFFNFQISISLLFSFVNINIVIHLQPVLGWRKSSECIKGNSSEHISCL